MDDLLIQFKVIIFSLERQCHWVMLAFFRTMEAYKRDARHLNWTQYLILLQVRDFLVFLTLLFLILILLVWCSHQNAVRYFTDTLNSKFSQIYPAQKCSNWKDFKDDKCRDNPINYMGFDVNPSIQGKFYIDIKTEESHDSLELYNFVLGRIGKRIFDIFGF